MGLSMSSPEITWPVSDHGMASTDGQRNGMLTETEANLADSTLPAKANHPAWIPSALDGISQSLELINEKRIKVIVNG